MDINEFEDFQPLDFLDLANELNCNIEKFNASSSSVKRNIFGRIYYAAFLYVREWLLKHTNYASQPKKEHSTIPKYIKSNGPFSSEVNHNLSKNLKMLKKLRHQSDYYLEIPPLYSYEYSNWIFRDVSHAFILANEIITTLENN